MRIPVKKLFTVLFFLSVMAGQVPAAYGQSGKFDKIIRRDKTVIEAIVQEVTMDGDIAYKKFTSPKGATFKVAVKDVASIQYASGYVDEFPDEPLVLQAPTPSAPASSRDPKPNVPVGGPGELVVAKPNVPVGEASEPMAATERKPVPSNDPPAPAETRKEGRKTSSKRGVEIPAKSVTGLDFERVAMEDLRADVRNVREYAGEYQWRRSAKGPREMAYLVEWDNVNLVAKEWTGYSWRYRGNSERDVKLRGNKLIALGKTLGSFVKFDANGKEMRGFLVVAEDGREMFLWKVK